MIKLKANIRGWIVHPTNRKQRPTFACLCVYFAENCTNYKLQFERVFSVPGEVAMLNSTLLSPDVLNITAVPYNITWYNSKTGQEMSNQTGRILLVGETLWYLSTTLDDAGEYMMLLQYVINSGNPLQQCFATRLYI